MSSEPDRAPRRAFAPGHVNLIGDHTDYTGGLVLPVAIQLGTTVIGRPGGSTIELVSDRDPTPVRFEVGSATDAAGGRSAPRPAGWGAVVAAVAQLVRPRAGFVGAVASTVPLGAGLSSSASLEVALALALGFEGSDLELARLAQSAEHLASGVPCGLMDQLASVAGQAGHALLIDCSTDHVRPIAVPEAWEIQVVHSEVTRTLAGSAYAERREACERAESEIGPLRNAQVADLAGLTDATLHRRARHVVTENDRVRAFATALTAVDSSTASAMMAGSQRSLRDDFEVSHPEVDELVELLVRHPGVIGARMTGAGFGGCVVALTERGADLHGVAGGRRLWRVTASGGARLA